MSDLWLSPQEGSEEGKLMSIRDIIEERAEEQKEKEQDREDPTEKLDQLQEALGIAPVDWQNILDAKDVGDVEDLLVKYLGLEEAIPE